jgi:hypothetical protein
VGRVRVTRSSVNLYKGWEFGRSSAGARTAGTRTDQRFAACTTRAAMGRHVARGNPRRLGARADLGTARGLGRRATGPFSIC